jgi:hypothetical protein
MNIKLLKSFGKSLGKFQKSKDIIHKCFSSSLINKNLLSEKSSFNTLFKLNKMHSSKYTKNSYKQPIDVEIVTEEEVKNRVSKFSGSVSKTEFVNGEILLLKHYTKYVCLFYLKIGFYIILGLISITCIWNSIKNFKESKLKNTFKIVASLAVMVLIGISLAYLIALANCLVKSISLLKDGKRLKISFLYPKQKYYDISLVRIMKKDEYFRLNHEYIDFSKDSGYPLVLNNEFYYNEGDRFVEDEIYFLWNKSEIVNKELLKHVLSSQYITITD